MQNTQTAIYPGAPVIKTYLYHHIKLLLLHIRYKESCLRVKLIHQQRHHHYKRLRSTETIDVYPQIIVDVSNVSLNSN